MELVILEYLSTYLGYEDAGDFTVADRFKTSIHANLVFYLCVGSIGLFGVILLIIWGKEWNGGILGFAMACSNTFGLVTGAFLLGFALVEIPKSIWRNADWSNRQKALSHKVAKMAVKLDDAHQEFSNAIVVAQATSKQMSKRDPLRPFMNIIDKMLLQMLSEDPSFKPQGGRLGENDMDYDTDEKTMAALRRQLKTAREEYYRCKSEYMNFVTEALELEDTIKSKDHRDATGWKYISSFRPGRTGRVGSFIDVIELVWRCILRKEVEKVLAVILGFMSVAILLAEATILPSGVDLSFFSVLINAVGKEEVVVQVTALIPLMYMCVCTYYSLFKIGMLMFYSFTPKQTSPVSLLMICSMVARYAPPISYNFLNLIRLDDNRKTVFEKRMGNIDDAVPFFGKGFNKIYPLIMVIYTILIASNFFDRVIEYFGNWKIFKYFQSEADDLDGFDPSGLIILQKERSWIEQGHKVGELVIPLARNFHNVTVDLELGSSSKVPIEMKDTSKLIDDGQRSHSTTAKREAQEQSSRESIGKKYSAIRAQQNKDRSALDFAEDDRATSNSTTSSVENSQDVTFKPSLKIASTWESMKMNFQNLKSNMGAKKFLPLRQVPDTEHSRASSSESLDDIFRKLKQPNSDHRSYVNDDSDDIDDRPMDMRKPSSRR